MVLRYPDTTHGTTIDAEKRPGVVPEGSFWGGSPMAVPLVVFGVGDGDGVVDKSHNPNQLLISESHALAHV